MVFRTRREFSEVTYDNELPNDIKSRMIGMRSRIWQYVGILEGPVIGDDVNICSHCFIENDVVIGNRITIKNGVQLSDRKMQDKNMLVTGGASFVGSAL
jgi:UDP-2-acetamido-3-amino-2,3-dideoxy-glucuronate N-acetyltransferase